MVHAFECIEYNTLSEQEQSKARSCRGPCHRKLPNCTHLCPEICHPGQCPSPEKCGKKVVVRCKCLTLKKEWLCKDVQAAHRATGSDPKDVQKNHFGVGLLPCDSNCKSKQQMAESVLQQRNVKEIEEKEEPSGKNATKRRKRRERGQDIKETSRLQKLTVAAKKVVMVVMLIAVLVAVSYYGYKGILWLSDWMNEVEEQRQKSRRYPRI